MRQIFYTTIILLGLVTHAIAQGCIPAPKMNFGGTKIAWSYQVEDLTIDTFLCLGTSDPSKCIRSQTYGLNP